MKPRARDLGLPLPGKPGALNAITDIAGIEIGFSTLVDSSLGIRTGVTAILPRGHSAEPLALRAGHFSLNGNGEMTGTHWIEDSGHYLGPILITNTHAIGACHEGAVRWMIETYRDYFRNEHAWAMPVVAETYDGVLNDINRLSITPGHALEALRSARPGRVQEGSIGGGAGMIAYGFKGGTGTASRLVETGGHWTVGALVQANHGIRPWLTICGKRIGEAMPEEMPARKETGSVIVILATDAPLSPMSLRALARRAALGIGRGGTPGGNSSGDIFLAFSTAAAVEPAQKRGPIETAAQIYAEHLDGFYLAAVEAVEEAVINAMVAAEDAPTIKPPGGICRAIDIEKLRSFFA
jgi:D-aminopeptidase